MNSIAPIAGKRSQIRPTFTREYTRKCTSLVGPVSTADPSSSAKCCDLDIAHLHTITCPNVIAWPARHGDFVDFVKFKKTVTQLSNVSYSLFLSMLIKPVKKIDNILTELQRRLSSPRIASPINNFKHWQLKSSQ